MDQFYIPEPKWILDKTDAGPLVWRRVSEANNSRVKFRHDVEIKEFYRSDYELVDDGGSFADENRYHAFSTGIAFVVCVAVTMILPWYVMIGIN